MTVMGLATLLLEIKIYAFTLMPNHIHILLSGSGDQCVRLFSYLRRKLGDRLKEDGCPPLPENYGYQLIPVEDEEQMRANYLYLFRNPYEKGWTIPEGYRWGSCWLHYSMYPSVIRGARADTLTGRDLKRLTRSEQAIPGQWEFHPELGLLPISFVGNDFRADYKLLNSFIRQRGINIPPLVNAYMNLSPYMRVLGTAINREFGDVEETGILIKIADITDQKKDRHINSFINRN